MDFLFNPNSSQGRVTVAEELGGGNREAQRPLSCAEQMEMTVPAPHSLGDAKPPRCCSVPPIQAMTGPILAQV